MEFLVLVLLDVAACEDLFEMLGEGDVDRRDVFEVAVDLYPNLLLSQISGVCRQIAPVDAGVVVRKSKSGAHPHR